MAGTQDGLGQLKLVRDATFAIKGCPVVVSPKGDDHSSAIVVGAFAW